MKVFYYEICGRTINDKSKNRHTKTKRIYFTKNYVTNTYNYNDNVWDDVEKILHENIIIHNNKFHEPKNFVTCKINHDEEIEVYKDEQTSMTCVYCYLLSLMWKQLMFMLLVKCFVTSSVKI